jgi:hypothetical protein
MDPKRRRIIRIVALALALLILAFIVSRSGAPPSAPAAASPDAPAAASPGAAGDAPPHATSPSAEVSGASRYGIIGPATKADPHTVRRAVQSLTEPAPSQAPSQAPSAAPPDKP